MFGTVEISRAAFDSGDFYFFKMCVGITPFKYEILAFGQLILMVLSTQISMNKKSLVLNATHDSPVPSRVSFDEP